MSALVLERKEGEQLSIGPDIKVQVVRINPYTVRLRIIAPPEVAIVRDDVKRGKSA